MRCLVLSLLCLSTAQAHASTVLDRIRAAHSLTCGVVKEEEDYSRATDHGNRAAFDIDMCKAVAVAVLGSGARFTVKVYPDEPEGTAALAKGEVDLLPTASPTVKNQTAGLAFAAPTFYDAQGFLVRTDPAVHTARDLAGKKVCYLTGSEADGGVRAYAAREHIEYVWYPFSEAGEMEAAFFTGNCTAVTSDISSLANLRGINKSRAGEFTILPDHIRKDPLAPAWRAADPQFGAVVAWTVQALVEAEELGVTRTDLPRMKTSADPEVRLLLGKPFSTGRALGLDTHWAANVIDATGNYGEIFDRDLGVDSPLRLDRAENRLYTQGGLMYALPPGE